MTAACDFFTVPILTFKGLVCFFAGSEPLQEIRDRDAVGSERMAETIRRVCTVDLTPPGERHLLRSLLDFQDHNDGSRTHLDRRPA